MMSPGAPPVTAPVSGDSGQRVDDRVVTVLTACPDELTRQEAEVLGGLLDEEERSRLGRLQDDDARRQYLVAHALLRIALSLRYPAMPAEWRFRRTPTAQPLIQSPERGVPLFFSLSHTRSLVVCSVSTSWEVGVDVERFDASIDLEPLTPLVYSKEERLWWQQGDTATRVHRFFRLWTLKEALLKATGRGLTIPLSRVGFRVAGGQHPELMNLPPDLGRLRDWSFRMLEPTAEHVCALAVRAPVGAPFLVALTGLSVETLAAQVRRQRPAGPRIRTVSSATTEQGVSA